MTNEAVARMPANELFGLQMLQLSPRVTLRNERLMPPAPLSEPALDPGARLVLHGPDSPRRRELESFIQAEYQEHFDANVTEFMPTFLALHDARGRICAAVGCRSASFEPLFLEVYTDQSIEDAIAARAGVGVARAHIVEIGSLACRDSRAAVAIIRALIPYLIDAGFTWVAFTGADTVVRVLRHLNLEPLALCVADSERLGSARDAWGSYYDHDPIVMAGRLLDGVDALDCVPSVQ